MLMSSGAAAWSRGCEGKRERSGRCQDTGWRKRQQDVLMDLIWKEGQGWRECFLFTIILLGAQKQLHNSQAPVRNENVGPLVQKVLRISRQG